jgi:hypothetical protein
MISARQFGLIGCVLLLLPGCVRAQVTRQDFLRADQQTVRLKPSAFSNLPPVVRTELEHRGCTIPQPAGADHAKNVVTGSFIAAGESDWAVLCSHNMHSQILIFRSGTTDQVDEVGDAPDLNYLQVVSGDHKIGYSRLLRAINAISLKNRMGKRTGKDFDHDGMEDGIQCRPRT